MVQDGVEEAGQGLAGEKWYERLDRLLSEIPVRTGGSNQTNPKHATRQLESLKQRAETAFEELRTKHRAIDDDALTRRVLQSGTLTDKVAAMALAVAEFPMQSLAELEKLVGMSGSKGRREASLAMDALRDLLIDSLLPPTRRLNLLTVSLETLALNRPGITSDVLGMLVFEDLLKAQVALFVRNLEKAAKDELTHHKVMAMKRASDLLIDRPEQERFLLSLLCSKMGDPDHKAAAQASHLLRKVTNRHPQMRMNVVAELEASILSSSATSAYVYESTIYLNQTILNRGDVELANRLVDIYFALFEQSLAVVEKLDESKKNRDRGSRKKKKKSSPEAVEAKKGLNSRLLAALLTGVNRALPFCEAKSDAAKLKFKERCDHLHRIVTETETFSNATQALALLYKLETDRDKYHAALNAKLVDPALIEGKKTAFLNLLYKSLKTDSNRSRSAHTIKTLLHVALRSSAAFAAASLFLLSNVLASKPALMVDLLGEDNEDAGEESRGGEGEGSEETKPRSTTALANVQGGDDDQVTATNASKEKKKTMSTTKKVEFSVAWELDSFRTHYHPTVQAFAKSVLQRDPIEYSGDPLHDFSVTSFLDRFVYRNPKEKKPTDGGSEPDSSQVFGSKGREQRLGKKTASELPVNSEAFHQKMAQRRNRIGEETDRFFFRYFDSLKKQGVSLAQGAAAGRETDLEELEDAYADTLVEGLLKKAAGGTEADVDDDLDDEFSPAEDNEEEDEFDEMEGDGANFSGEEEDFDQDELDDEDDFDDEDDDEMSDEDETGGGGPRSIFADAEDFAGLIGAGDDEEINDKAKWVTKSNKRRHQAAAPNKGNSKKRSSATSGTASKSKKSRTR